MNSQATPVLKSPDEIESMARAGGLVGRVFAEIEHLVVPGTRTIEIDHAVRDLVFAAGGEPLFLGYRGFPAHCCISVNDEIVHGIPGARSLQDGDVVSIDIGIRIDGYCGDSARSFLVGDPSPEARRVVECCREALWAGIRAIRPGGLMSELSGAIEDHILGADLHVVRRYVGHGIGREMHEEPPVPNFRPPSGGPDPVLEPGLVIAVEPMVTLGTEDVRVLEDSWTVITADGGPSAHCEHTVAVTDSGARVLTLAPGEVQET